MNDRLLKNEEKIVFALRELYGKYGYLPYSMSKFEEYELYIRHKEFMVSDRVIAFNDTNGKLLALKPDVTLSIIKSGEDIKGFKQKVYYNENVYRVSKSTHRFKEIMQAGLECIGDIDLYDIYEVIRLAAESLSVISENFVLSISHLGVVLAVLGGISSDENFTKDAVFYISQRNIHELSALCEKYGICKEDTERLCVIANAYGEREKVLSIIKNISDVPETSELESLSRLLDSLPFADKITFDFSLVGDTNYYNGFVFKGFIDGVASDVLSGGQYDRMMKQMGRRSKAIGFAVYLDMLSALYKQNEGFDIDMLVLYDESISAKEVAKTVSELTAKGYTCSAQKNICEKLRYGKLVDLRKEKSENA